MIIMMSLCVIDSWKRNWRIIGGKWNGVFLLYRKVNILSREKYEGLVRRKDCGGKNGGEKINVVVIYFVLDWMSSRDVWLS